MKTIKKVKKKSKKVLGRKPDSVFHVKETLFVEDYVGGPKRKVEILHAVDNFAGKT